MTQHLLFVAKFSLLAFLVCSMLAAGIGLTARAVLEPLREVRVLLVAVGLNFVFAPAFAWLLARMIQLQSGHAEGLLLLSAAAGAPFLPKLIEAAHGEVAVAVGMMVLLTAGTLFFLPSALPYLAPNLEASTWRLARPLLWVMVAPLAAGCVLKLLLPKVSALVATVLGALGNVALIVFLALLVALNLDDLHSVIGSGAILASTIFFAGLFAAGWCFGGPGPDARSAMALGTAARNFGVALVPTAGGAGHRDTTAMIVAGGIVGLLVCGAGAVWIRRRSSSPAG